MKKSKLKFSLTADIMRQLRRSNCREGLTLLLQNTAGRVTKSDLLSMLRSFHYYGYKNRAFVKFSMELEGVFSNMVAEGTISFVKSKSVSLVTAKEESDEDSRGRTQE